ncbi:MAG: excinuclease ABC subunit C [Bacteroidetes bacterium GWF2_33_16]|nr:MAG: excinuclease ABC subunit C [Bacteroidetes bacterium GWE2_32_14]OFY03446.1 MAG: excinuclease ABC subunit C [Bacteroidetes bacterium GWF2_33_16]
MAKNSSSQELKIDITVFPDSPGVYLFYNTSDEIIYVGKAKNIKKRVSSYFTRENYENNKVRVLVSKISRIEYIVVNTESDALLLENNLIKKHKPRYNVLLKDDKTYPWICIKNEPFPRVFYTRNLINDGSKYFGPYTSVYMVKILLDLIKQLYPLRNCNLSLTKENIIKNKFKSCLEYHIGNCKAPCIGLQKEDDYEIAIEHIYLILKGNIIQVIHYLTDLMNSFSAEFKFEDAQIIKDKIETLERYKSKSTIVSSHLNDIDVFSILDDSTSAYVNFLRLVEGRIVQAHTLEIKKKLDEPLEDLLVLAIVELRERFSSQSKEIIVPINVSLPWKEVKTNIPQKGDKKALLELSERNAKYFRLEKQKNIERKKEKHSSKRILEILKKDLNLPVLPQHIECFDNSNIQGSNPVAACVVFKNAKPSVKEYRHFNIKTVEGPNDYASMEEVVYRRYKRMIDENKELPQLIVIDGGKGQLSSATKSLNQLGVLKNVSIIGIAKRLEEIYYPNDPVPLYLDKNSVSLKIIQHIRNEAHRFGIKFHRNKRSGSFIQSELNEIPGIGDKTIEQLFKKYKSIKKILQLEEDDLSSEIGQTKARLLRNYFTGK